MNTLFYIVPVASLVALFFAWLFYHQMKKESEGVLNDNLNLDDLLDFNRQ